MPEKRTLSLRETTKLADVDRGETLTNFEGRLTVNPDPLWNFSGIEAWRHKFEIHE